MLSSWSCWIRVDDARRSAVGVGKQIRIKEDREFVGESHMEDILNEFW